jgi:protease secretion system outer membrane protein
MSMHRFGLALTAACAAGAMGWRFAVGVAVGLVSVSVCAQGLGTPLTLPLAYDAAVRHDAQYQIATKELEFARQGVPLARASLLPQVSLNASTAKVVGTREFGNSLNQNVKVPLDYESPQASLNLRAPIFNYEALSRLRQATSASDGAEALLAARHIDLVNRLTAAYLEVLLQHEVLALAAEDLRSLQAQADRARRRFTLGEGTLQEATAAESAAELARIRLVRIQDDVVIARRSLQRITGLDASALRAAPADFAGLALPLPTLQAWIEQTLQNSPLLRFRRLSLDAAGFGIERQRAGHYPRLDLVAGMSRAESESIATLNQTTQQRSIGVQLAVPLFSGGAVEAGVAQSIAERDRVEQELRAEEENLVLEVERLYRLTVQGASRLAANLAALDAAGVAVKAAERAQATGLGTDAEYRQALARQALARRDLIQARYEFLNQRSQLLLMSGWPSAQVLEETARVLSVDATMKEESLR